MPPLSCMDLPGSACLLVMSEIEKVDDLKIQSVGTSELTSEGEPDEQLRRRVLRKLDLQLLPVATVLYLLAYL